MIFKDSNFVRLSPEEAFEFLEHKEALKYTAKHNMIFVDGYFVVADKKYVREHNGKFHLTKYAKKHLSECRINASI